MANAKKSVHANVGKIQIANKEPNVVRDSVYLQVNVSLNSTNFLSLTNTFEYHRLCPSEMFLYC